MPSLDLSYINLYANVDKRLLITSDGVPIGGDALPQFWREEIVILRITCLDNNLAAVAFAETNTFELGIAQDYDQETAVLCMSEDDQVNIANDWDDADLTAGKLSVRINTYTEEYNTHVGTNAEKRDTRIYLRKFGSSVANIVFDYSCICHNIARASGSVPEGVSEPEYRTAAAQDVIDATKADLEGTSDIEITDSGKGWIFTTANGGRRRLTVDNNGLVNVSDPL